MKVTDNTSLFTDALNVMNRALREHKDDIVYKPLLEGANRVLSGQKLGVAVYTDDPDTPFDYYTIRYADGQFELVEHGKEDPAVAWKVPRSYLAEVASNPDRYIEQPAKLDWDWLKERLRIGS